MAEPTPSRPRVGVPWRTAAEETANQRAKIEKYLQAVERAGGEPVLLSLVSGAEYLKREAQNLDAVLLSGSPADIEPAHYGAKRHRATENADPARERSDFALLEHALAAGKPVLAVCYGIQSLNVFLGGTLVQDIPSELGTKVCHSSDRVRALLVYPETRRGARQNDDELPAGGEAPDAVHAASFESGRLSVLSRTVQAEVNSSHHQSVLAPGRGLRVTARAPDGVIEALEGTEGSNWVVGVQWHPERMPGDVLAQALFRDLVLAARQIQVEK